MMKLFSRAWLRFVLGPAIVLSLGGLLTWAFIEGREEMDRERERERPIRVPPRIKIEAGVTYIELDETARALAGVETKTLREVASLSSASIVYSDGKPWVYLEMDGGRYRRVPAKQALKNNSGRVVTVGAQLLLSEELKSNIQVLGEEGGR